MFQKALINNLQKAVPITFITIVNHRQGPLIMCTKNISNSQLNNSNQKEKISLRISSKQQILLCLIQTQKSNKTVVNIGIIYENKTWVWDRKSACCFLHRILIKTWQISEPHQERWILCQELPNRSERA